MHYHLRKDKYKNMFERGHPSNRQFPTSGPTNQPNPPPPKKKVAGKSITVSYPFSRDLGTAE